MHFPDIGHVKEPVCRLGLMPVPGWAARHRISPQAQLAAFGKWTSLVNALSLEYQGPVWNGVPSVWDESISIKLGCPGSGVVHQRTMMVPKRSCPSIVAVGLSILSIGLTSFMNFFPHHQFQLYYQSTPSFFSPSAPVAATVLFTFKHSFNNLLCLTIHF